MTVAEALHWAAQALANRASEEARLEAEVLLMHVLNWDRARLYAHGEELLALQHEDNLRQLVARRRRGEPLAYIVGHKEFYGLDFLVDRRVLQPRPETELLVEEALRLARDRFAPDGDGCIIADIGTGTGCIAISLAVHLPRAKIYATDISAEALEVAAANCRRHGVAERICLLHGDLLAPLPEPVDIIAADLPYMSELDLLPAIQQEVPGVFLGEPLVALSGGPDGLDKIRQLFAEAGPKLKPGGAILIEMAWDQGPRVTELAQRHFPEAQIKAHRDLAGHERMVSIETEC